MSSLFYLDAFPSKLRFIQLTVSSIEGKQFFVRASITRLNAFWISASNTLSTRLVASYTDALFFEEWAKCRAQCLQQFAVVDLVIKQDFYSLTNQRLHATISKSDISDLDRRIKAR